MNTIDSLAFMLILMYPPPEIEIGLIMNAKEKIISREVIKYNLPPTLPSTIN